MKIQLFFVGLLLTGASGFAGTCVPGSLQDYFGLDPVAGCTAGAITFRNFAPASGQFGATLIDPATITVSPGGTFLQPNLLFGVNMTAGSNQFLESFFRFEVLAPVVGNPSIALSPASNASGDGAVSAIADICVGGFFIPTEPTGCPTTTGSLLALKIAFDSVPFDSARFLSGSFFDVFVDLAIDGGPSGQATLGSATFGVTAVPEPATLALAAAALTALALRRRRANR